MSEIPDDDSDNEQIKDNTGEHARNNPEHDLPIFQDKCRSRGDSNDDKFSAQNDPRVVSDLDTNKTRISGLPNKALSEAKANRDRIEAEARAREALSPDDQDAPFPALENDDEYVEPSLDIPDVQEISYYPGERDRDDFEAEAQPTAHSSTTLTDRGGRASGTSLPSTVAGPLRAIQYSAIKNRASLMDQLNKTIPLNPLGLPVFIYRPDLLNYQMFQTLPTVELARELTDILGSAIINLAYDQGFPSMPDGMPLWARFEWEPAHDYQVFTEFLEQEGIRSIHRLQGVDGKEALESFSLYLWSFRAKAFDLYQGAHKARKRVHRILSAEDNHYEIAAKLLNKVNKRISEMDDEDFADMDPKTAADVLDKLVRVQRLSLGLANNGNDDGKNRRHQVPIEETMRTMVESQTQVDTRAQQDADVDLLRDSPESIELAQQLLLMMGGPGSQAKVVDADSASGVELESIINKVK